MTITVCKLVRFKSVSPKRLFTLLILFSCLSSLALFVLWQSAPARAVVPPGQHQLETFRLLDLPSFGYRLSTGSCDNVTAMLLIVSHQGNVEQRAEIRRSYPADHLRSLGVGRVFLLGVTSTLSDYASVSETQVTQEAAEHRDIVQSHLPESYRRLVYKHAMGLHWALRHCSPLSTRLLIKMDDDIVVDLYQLLARLSPLIPTPRSSLLAGWVHFNLEPVRQTDSKWFVSQRELPEESRYPPFLSGWLYAVSLRSASALLSALSRLTLDSPPFWIDDVFVTGRAAAAANLSLTSLNAFYATDWRYLACCLQQPRHHRCAFLVSWTRRAASGRRSASDDTVRGARQTLLAHQLFAAHANRQRAALMCVSQPSGQLAERQRPGVSRSCASRLMVQFFPLLQVVCII